MKLQSTIDLPYNVGITSNGSAIICGQIMAVNYSNDFTTIAVTYKYTLQDGTILESGVYILEGVSQINAQFNAIYPLLPAANNDYPYMQTKFYTAFKYLMAQTWGVSADNISIIS